MRSDEGQIQLVLFVWYLFQSFLGHRCMENMDRFISIQSGCKRTGSSNVKTKAYVHKDDCMWELIISPLELCQINVNTNLTLWKHNLYFFPTSKTNGSGSEHLQEANCSSANPYLSPFSPTIFQTPPKSERSRYLRESKGVFFFKKKFLLGFNPAIFSLHALIWGRL